MTELQSNFNELTQAQQSFVKSLVMSVIANCPYSKGSIATHDVDHLTLLNLQRGNVPPEKQQAILPHIQAAIWVLEAEGKLTRSYRQLSLA